MIPLILSLDYQHAPVALREQLVFPTRDLPQALRALATRPALAEVALLSTCNRVAIIAATTNLDTAWEQLCDFLSLWHHLPRETFEPHLVSYHDDAAVMHLMEVASGLLSLVPGEGQILGQVRDAHTEALAAGSCGPFLDAIFQSAIRAGRRARSETAIARHPMSVSHAAVALAVEHFGSLVGRKFLLIGSGKMGELAAHQLHDAGASHFIIANRSRERALEVAQRWNGTALSLDEMPGCLAQVDAVIACTAAPHHVLSVEQVAEALAERQAGRAPLLLIDLAVPRDIHPDAAALRGVALYDVDGLQAVVARNLALRHAERQVVEGIIVEEYGAYRRRLNERGVAPTITALHQRADAIRQAEVERTLRRLAHLPETERAAIEALSRSIVNKLLHTPTVRLKARTAEGDSLTHQTLRHLFGLDDTPAPPCAGGKAAD